MPETTQTQPTSEPVSAGPGRVYLVGAGPGDPKLVTLRGVECLQQADLVLYDYLVNPQILEHAPAAARLECMGRHGQGKIVSQAQINERLVAEAQTGKTVVRLKGGDPAIFARAAEEIDTLLAAQIPFEVVPGITAALAAGSYAGISITHRDEASGVALIAGQEGTNKAGESLDYAALACFPGTLVFYMAVTTAPAWSEALLAAGKPGETPVAIIRRCSWPDQQTIECELQNVAQTLAQHQLRPPAIIIVGQVARPRTAAWWFNSRPLFGKTILISRPEDQSLETRARFQSLGAEVLIQPAIRISEPADWQPVDTALGQLDSFDWLVFSSANGVRYFMQRLLQEGGDLRRLGGLKLAAIGPATAAALEGFHLRTDLIPNDYRAEALAEQLAANAQGKRFLLARASRGREVLAEQLTAAGGEVRQTIVYQSTDVEQADAEIVHRMQAGEIDWTTVTSSAIARSLVGLFGEALRKTHLASISPITSGVLRELGFDPAAEAAQYTTDGLEAAILAEI